MLGSSLGLIVVFLALTLVLGQSPQTLALLFSTFHIALVLSCLPTSLKSYPVNVRIGLVILGIVASYGFALGVMLIADRF